MTIGTHSQHKDNTHRHLILFASLKSKFTSPMQTLMQHKVYKPTEEVVSILWAPYDPIAPLLSNRKQLTANELL